MIWVWIDFNGIGKWFLNLEIFAFEREGKRGSLYLYDTMTEEGEKFKAKS